MIDGTRAHRVVRSRLINKGYTTFACLAYKEKVVNDLILEAAKELAAQGYLMVDDAVAPNGDHVVTVTITAQK